MGVPVIGELAAIRGAGLARRHRHVAARASVVLGGQDEQQPSGAVVDGDRRLLPGTGHEHRVAPMAFAGRLMRTFPGLLAIGVGLLIGSIVLIVTAIVVFVLGARPGPGSSLTWYRAE